MDRNKSGKKQQSTMYLEMNGQVIHDDMLFSIDMCNDR